MFVYCSLSIKDHKLNILEKSQRITAREYSEMLENQIPHVLLDVRPTIELDICRLPHPAINIPYPSLSRNIAEAKHQILHKLEELTSSNNTTNDRAALICVCRRGNDSQLAVQELSQAMPEVKFIDIKGGLHSWSKNVDSNFPIY